MRAGGESGEERGLEEAGWCSSASSPYCPFSHASVDNRQCKEWGRGGGEWEKEKEKHFPCFGTASPCFVFLFSGFFFCLCLLSLSQYLITFKLHSEWEQREGREWREGERERARNRENRRKTEREVAKKRLRKREREKACVVLNIFWWTIESLSCF